jgi:hypothetical protein
MNIIKTKFNKQYSFEVDIMGTISFIFDKKDYYKKLTEDEIINVTGAVGSGKSTYGLKYRTNGEYIVIGLDSIFGDMDSDTRNQETNEIKQTLVRRYGELDKNNIAEYYYDMVEYIRVKNKKGIIEGGFINEINLIPKLKGEVIVKRTAKIKCYYRSVIRDCKNPDWLIGLNFWGKVKRYLHVAKRRKKIFSDSRKVDNFINALEKYNR